MAKRKIKKEEPAVTDIKKRYTKEDIKDSQKWFKDQVQKIGRIKLYSMSDLRSQTDKKILPGKMIAFKYDPKWKNVLPFYDIYPLVIVVDILPDGFVGLNLHYLPPKLRAVFLGRLMKIMNNNKLDKSSKLNLSYGVLKSAAKYKYFKPCFKRYLGKHLRSQLQVIQVKHWPRAIMLPTAKFKGASAPAVWKDSKTKY